MGACAFFSTNLCLHEDHRNTIIPKKCEESIIIKETSTKHQNFLEYNVTPFIKLSRLQIVYTIIKLSQIWV